MRSVPRGPRSSYWASISGSKLFGSCCDTLSQCFDRVKGPVPSKSAKTPPVSLKLNNKLSTNISNLLLRYGLDTVVCFSREPLGTLKRLYLGSLRNSERSGSLATSDME